MIFNYNEDSFNKMLLYAYSWIIYLGPGHIDPIAILESFRALKLFRLENFRALKLFRLENYRALKP